MMDFFILLALSFCCCQATPLPAQEVDCNDPDVFNAVDLTLQKFNGARTHGNQFALVVVSEAGRTADLGTSFLLVVKYQIRETVCAIGGGIPWQNCEFKELLEADSGECNAQIYIDDLINFSNVSQECRIIPAENKVTASRATCTGCWAPIATNSLELLPLVRHTIRRFNNEDHHPSLFEVLEITRAQSQVVAGWNYAFEYLIKETNCSKAEFPELTPACKRIPKGRVGKCLAVAHINMTKGLSYAVQECALQVEEDVISSIRRCPGCPKPLATNSTELEEPLRAALEKYNSESNDEAYYKVEQILNAEVQVVAGTKYNIRFIIVKTNCSKMDFQELNEDCSPEKAGERQQCNASIYVIPWQSKIFPNVTCEPHRHRASLAVFAWPPGMTPFRSFVIRAGLSLFPTESGQMASSKKAGNHLPGSIRGLGAAPSRDLGLRHKREQTKDHSFEESHEGVKKQEETSPRPVAKTLEDQPSPAKPCRQEEEPHEDGAGCPRSTSQQENRESPGLSVLDLLPESDAPKCPGTPWKPITALPTTDLEVVVGAEQHEAASQDFDLADALPLS